MAAYVQPKGLAGAVKRERVAIWGAPGSARASLAAPSLKRNTRPVPLGASRQSSYFRGGTGGQGWPKAITK
ncbi:hypothetical protein GCM10010215_72510 [Streptomyces virginiae]|nr:hypothetical protein GCM10010215_72510 [Streptomyces virginiae]